MVRKYLYKNIIVFRSYGTWQANYKDGYREFVLHRGCYPTRYMAYNSAKEEVDYLNKQEAKR